MSDYRRAAELVLVALDLPPADRAALLDRECWDDTALRADVESLLGAHDRAGGFLETPPDAVALDDAPLGPGTAVGPYRIARVLGEGGMGIVYLAEDTRLGRSVALKSITPRFTNEVAWRERLTREARAAAALTHPGIATVFALEEIDGRLYLAAEYVTGETLRERLNRGPVAEDEVRSIGRQLAAALAAAHDRGVVHRDLKPENVMLTPGAAVKILDFGLASMNFGLAQGEAGSASGAGAQLTKDGAVFGTPAYMSPEQLRGETAGPTADVFALGVMLAELSTGRHPFAGANPAVTVARSLSAEPDLTGVPASLTPVIATCLAKSAHDRFRSAHELRAALDRSAQPGSATGSSRANAFWWWQFDQATASAFSVALAAAVWAVHDGLPVPFGTPIMLVTLVGALATATLRLHLWFSARVLAADIAGQRSVAPWVKVAGALEAAGVAAAGLLLPPDRSVAAALFTASAVVLVLVVFVIGPAATRAAKLN